MKKQTRIELSMNRTCRNEKIWCDVCERSLCSAYYFNQHVKKVIHLKNLSERKAELSIAVKGCQAIDNHFGDIFPSDNDIEKLTDSDIDPFVASEIEISEEKMECSLDNEQLDTLPGISEFLDEALSVGNDRQRGSRMSDFGGFDWTRFGGQDELVGMFKVLESGLNDDPTRNSKLSNGHSSDFTSCRRQEEPAGMFKTIENQRLYDRKLNEDHQQRRDSNGLETAESVEFKENYPRSSNVLENANTSAVQATMETNDICCVASSPEKRGDGKPDNLVDTSSGTPKPCDMNQSQNKPVPNAEELVEEFETDFSASPLKYEDFIQLWDDYLKEKTNGVSKHKDFDDIRCINEYVSERKKVYSN